MRTIIVMLGFALLACCCTDVTVAQPGGDGGKLSAVERDLEILRAAVRMQGKKISELEQRGRAQSQAIQRSIEGASTALEERLRRRFQREGRTWPGDPPDGAGLQVPADPARRPPPEPLTKRRPDPREEGGRGDRPGL